MQTDHAIQAVNPAGILESESRETGLLAGALDRTQNGQENLWLSVLTLALRDLRDQRYRATAIQFLLSDKCSVFCHRAGVPDLLPAFQQQAENYRDRPLGFNDINAYSRVHA